MKEQEGTPHKEINVMPETKPNTAKLHGGGGREFARQGASFAKDVSENSKATAEETMTALEKTYSIVATGAADFHHQWIEIVRFNTNSTLDFAQQLLGVFADVEIIVVRGSIVPDLTCLICQVAYIQHGMTKAFHAEGLYTFGIDTSPTEGIDEGEPIVPLIVPNGVGVCRDDGPQVVSESKVYRGAIVQGSDTHVQYMAGGFGSFTCQAVNEVGV